MEAREYDNNGRLVARYENGKKVWSRKEELAEVAEKAAGAAARSLGANDNKKRKARQNARKAVIGDNNGART